MNGLRLALVSAVCVHCAWTPLLHAQTPGAPPHAGSQGPRVTPPVPLSVPDIAYPEGASGVADVIVTLVVGEDGKVREVKVVDGPSPFAEAVRARISELSYEPATKDGKPMAAIIRVAFHFEPPKPKVAPLDPAQDAPEPQPSESETKTDAPKHESPKEQAPQEQAPEEVRVTGVREKPAQVQSLSRAEVRQLPGAFGDPFRAIDVLPGVVPTVSGLPFFYVRGAPPSNVGYFLDGVRVPYLFHLGLGPSVVHPGLVDRVELYSGAFPAEYGRYAGAIVSAETTTPRDKFVEANVRLFDAGVLGEYSFLDGKLNVMLGGRYSYTAWLLSALFPQVGLDYSDYQARVSYQLSNKLRVSLFAFGAADIASQIEKNPSSGKDEKNVLFASEFHRVDLRLDYQDTEATQVRGGLTLGVDRTRLEGKRFTRNVSLGARLNASHRLSDSLLLRAGSQINVDAYGNEFPSEYALTPEQYRQTKTLFQERADIAAGVYAEAQLNFGKALEITPGLRVDWFRSLTQRELALDPRVSGKLKLLPWLKMNFSHGIAHQPPAFPIPVPAIAIPGLGVGLQRIFQTSGGLEADLPLDTSATLSGFKNSFENVSDLFASKGGKIDDPFGNGRSRHVGYAFGLEAGLRRKLSKSVGGIVSYTLSRSVREGLPSPFDRSHVLNVAASVDLGRGWRVGSRFLLYTGWPGVGEDGGRTGSRLPAFYRIDARIEKKWKWPSGIWLSLIIEGLNVTLNKETISIRCADRCREEKFGPVSVPSLGLEGGI
jgi:TonB dependent receptor/TonB-dependent Receptor Plug Domain/Gram-negative bacterial TonB protein C-terminal